MASVGQLTQVTNIATSSGVNIGWPTFAVDAGVKGFVIMPFDIVSSGPFEFWTTRA
jgi:hypothetical protein